MDYGNVDIGMSSRAKAFRAEASAENLVDLSAPVGNATTDFEQHTLMA